MEINITSELRKNKKDEYKGLLNITNSTNSDITSYYIVCILDNNSTIDDIKNFDIINIDSTTLNLLPVKKTTLKANDTIKIKFKGKGNMPTNFKGIKGSPPPPPEPPSPDDPTVKKEYVYNIPITDLNDISQITNSGPGFKYQWSYDQMKGYSNTNPNPNYFKISQPNGLEINIYSTDKPFESGSSTTPRTELRGLAKVLDNKTYIYSFDQFLVNEPTFDYAWFQVFGGNGPNIIIRWRKGSFELLSIQGDKQIVKFNGNPTDDIGKWVNWKLEFVLSTNNGYSKLYRNNVLVASTTPGNNSGDNNSYIKNGIYSQQMNPSNDVKVYKKNLELYYLIK